MRLLGFSTQNRSFNIVFKNNNSQKYSRTSDFIDYMQESKMLDNLDKKLSMDIFEKSIDKK